MPEVIPELVYIVGLFFAVVGYLAARGLLATWTHSLGYLLEWLGKQADISVSSHGIGFTIPFGAPFRAVDKFVVTALQNWAAGAEIEMGYCLHGMEKVGRYMAQAIDYLARETSQTFDWLVDIHVPKWVKYAAPTPLLPLLIPKLLASLLPLIQAKVHRATKAVEGAITQTFPTYITRVVGGAVALPGWVIHIPRRLRGIESEAGKLNKRLHKVEGVLAAGVLAGLMANVLGVTARCLRSGNVGKVTRRLCGLGPRALEDLLGLIVDVVLIADVCQVTRMLNSALTLVEGPITDFVSVAEGALCHGDYHAPPALAVAPLSLPPVTGLALSLG